MHEQNIHRLGMLAVVALALGASSYSGGAHAQASSPPVYLAQAQCGPTDSTVSCCVKTHPGNPERCGATQMEAADILLSGKAAAELARRDLPEWKKLCLETYVACQEEDWLGSCYECFRYCEGQQGEWPEDRCRPKKKGR